LLPIPCRGAHRPGDPEQDPRAEGGDLESPAGRSEANRHGGADVLRAELHPDEVPPEGIVERRPPVVLEGEVECDEVYVVAGHKGHPKAVKKKAVLPDGDA